MLSFLRRRWFMVAILLLIPLGIWLGLRAQPREVSQFPKWIVQIVSGVMTALILFLMSVTLENRRLWQSLRAPAPVIWGATVCYLIIPLMALALLPLQQLGDFAVGLMVVASVPSTLAAASVWTRKAGGNDAISLLVTVLTNGTCFLVTPLWLQFGLGDAVNLNARELILQLFLTALLPILVGQSFRLWPWFRNFADNAKNGFNAVAQVCILAIVFWASVQSGVKVNAGESAAGGLRVLPALVAWGSCIVLHFAGLVLAIWGGILWRFSREDTVGTAFAGSQKTLPIGLFVAASVAGDAPFALLPVLMFHASQLVLDTLLLDRLQRWVSGGAEETSAEVSGDA
ncbi:bile acid:sodium symporter [Planctomicrobium sp. SH661]|uniref:bile acid:sodium symporter n=1 Tax=Planctomicrobium sp. SH661 TaxID=3448124 RepID=UPI003F5BAEDE